jgi:hypothetical protein
MGKEKIMENERILAVGVIIIAIILILTGCGKKEDNSENIKNENQEQVQNVEKQNENNTSNKDKNETKNESKNTSSDKNNSKSDDSSSIKKATTPSKLNVSREGTTEEVSSKEYSSSLGYTIRYATDNFKVSNHDNADWFECEGDINCVVVKKENTSYSKKVASLSNYKKTTVNGYEAVYTTKKAEGQAETTYYVNVGKDYIYEITTSCQDTSEYLEGLGHIMDAMVQTFAVK